MKELVRAVLDESESGSGGGGGNTNDSSGGSASGGSGHGRWIALKPAVMPVLVPVLAKAPTGPCRGYADGAGTVARIVWIGVIHGCWSRNLFWVT